jgi:hypothetical protein
VTLVRPLFNGPIDIVGDVHGEIDALTALLQRLGYSPDGSHPQHRHLVFVGDLVDRGPDSPGVCQFVHRLVKDGQAQCVLGNHEFNILIGSRKSDNTWFFHHSLPAGHPDAVRPQAPADAHVQEEMLQFFRQLPLALERPNVRVVHACWDAAMIEVLRKATDCTELYHSAQQSLEKEIKRRGLTDHSAIRLVRQNENPVKLVTSGREAKAPVPFLALGKMRYERRVPWWDDYAEAPLCVFGHYWRTLLPGEEDGDQLFGSLPRNVALGRGNAMCIDYSVGKRFKEREAPDFDGTFRTQLAALRLPERVLLFDNGEELPLVVG